MQIRKMTKQDVPRVSEIDRNCFSNPWSEKSFTTALEHIDYIYLVAEETEIVGYIGIWTSFESADLCHIAVEQKYRQKGIAQHLLSQAIEVCKEQQVERILLEVRSHNAPAVCFYKKNEFKQIAVRVGYYTKPVDDALIMEKVLS